MTLNKMLHKLGNAERAMRGHLVRRPGRAPTPMWADSAPQPHAVYRRDLWRGRIQQKLQYIAAR